REVLASRGQRGLPVRQRVLREPDELFPRLATLFLPPRRVQRVDQEAEGLLPMPFTDGRLPCRSEIANERAQLRRGVVQTTFGPSGQGGVHAAEECLVVHGIPGWLAREG